MNDTDSNEHHLSEAVTNNSSSGGQQHHSDTVETSKHLQKKMPSQQHFAFINEPNKMSFLHFPRTEDHLSSVLDDMQVEQSAGPAMFTNGLQSTDRCRPVMNSIHSVQQKNGNCSKYSAKGDQISTETLQSTESQHSTKPLTQPYEDDPLSEPSPTGSIEDELKPSPDEKLFYHGVNISGSDEEDGSSVTNIIINYLPPNLNQDDIRRLFAFIGEVESCKLVRDKCTGDSLGYAFVNYYNPEDTVKAIHTLNGMRMQDKVIKVSRARPSCESIKGANLYICGLPKTMNLQTLEELFSRCGKIITARILYDNNTGLSRGVAFIRFDRRYEAEIAISHFDQYLIDGSSEPIIVKFANAPGLNRSDSLNSLLLLQNNQLQNLTANANINQLAALNVPFLLNNIRTQMPNLNSGGNNGNLLGNGLPFNQQELLTTLSRVANPSNLLNTMLTAAGCNNLVNGAYTSSGWCIFIYNLAPEVEESTIWQLFGPFGAVQNVKIVRDNVTGKCKSYGFVTMNNYEEALVAIQAINGYTLHNRILQVSFKTPSYANTFRSRNNNSSESNGSGGIQDVLKAIRSMQFLKERKEES